MSKNWPGMNIPLDTIWQWKWECSTSTRNSTQNRRRVPCSVPFVSDKEGNHQDLLSRVQKRTWDRQAQRIYIHKATSLALGLLMPETCMFLSWEKHPNLRKETAFAWSDCMQLWENRRLPQDQYDIESSSRCCLYLFVLLTVQDLLNHTVHVS